ncbi:MAG: MotA/TolQ/ExbB proton channel family protein [bacterium]
MDITTIAGLLLGFGSMIVAIVVEGKGDVLELVPFFTNISAWIIILGGTFGCTVLSSKRQDVARIPAIFIGLLQEAKLDHIAIIDTLTSLAEKARREGMISLEADIDAIENPMMAKGLRLVVDGTDPELVEAIMQTLLMQRKNDAAADATVFETLGGFAPTMGIVGTVMGLVGALKRMSAAGQEETISALAVAFIATFWGIGLANLLFLPLGNKVRARWRDEVILGQIIIEGIMSIQAGNNPRIVRDRLLSYLPLDVAEAADAAEPAKGGRE